MQARQSKPGRLATIFSYAYQRDNANVYKMLSLHVLELIIIATNVLLPVIIADFPRNKSGSNDNQDSLSETWNFYAPLVLASAGLLLTTVLPRIRDMALNSVRFNMQKKMVLDMTAGVYDREYDQQVAIPSGKYFSALTNNYHSVDRVMPVLVANVVPSMIETAGISGTLFYRYGIVGIAPAATLAAYFVVALILERTSKKRKVKNSEAMNQVFIALLQATGNYQIAHQYGNVKHELKQLEKALANLERSYNSVYGAQERNGLILSTISRLGFIAAFVYTFFLPPSPAFWEKDFILFSYYLFRSNLVTEPLPPKLSEFYKGYLDAQETINFLNQTSTVPDPSLSVSLQIDGPPSVEFRNVKMSYGEGKSGLANISFTVKPGQKLVIMGATGSGKSTILKLLQRFFSYEGQILINGVDITKLHKEELRSNLSVVSQGTDLMNGTLFSNLKYGDLQATEEDIYRAAEFAGLKFEKERYFAEIQQQGANFSGGEKQRINIARSLLKANSRIFLLDEPTSSLDQEMAKGVMKVLDRLTADSTTITVTHDVTAAINADYILYIDQGKITELGTFAQLIQKKGSFFAQVSAQCEKLGVSVSDMKPIKEDKKETITDFLAWRANRRQNTHLGAQSSFRFYEQGARASSVDDTVPLLTQDERKESSTSIQMDI